MKKIALMLLAAASLFVCGCTGTFNEIKPLSVGPSPAVRPAGLALGEIKVTDSQLSPPEQQMMTHAFQTGIEKWAAENKTIEISSAASPTNVPPNTIVLSGEITEVEKGSAAQRFWVGMGAGQARIVGQFDISSPDGSKLLSFTARKSYLGGAGIGGWDMLDMDELASRLGQLVMETTAKWIQGEKIE